MNNSYGESERATNENEKSARAIWLSVISFEARQHEQVLGLVKELEYHFKRVGRRVRSSLRTRMNKNE